MTDPLTKTYQEIRALMADARRGAEGQRQLRELRARAKRLEVLYRYRERLVEESL